MKKNTAPRAEPAAEIGAPRLAGLWSALVYALATLWLGAPALAGKFLINIHSDQYLAGYAFREFAAHTLRTTGSFPLWNPYIYGGLPYVAAMHGDIFYPTFLLRMIMPTDVAMTVGFMVHIFLAGWFTYFFLRAWGLGFYPALLGGLAYMMGGPIASYVSPGHDGKLFVSALTPLALWMLVRGIRDGRLWAFGVFAFTTGLAVLSPHPQLLQYDLLLSGAFALFLAFSAGDRDARLPRNTAYARLGLAAVAVAIGMLIGAFARTQEAAQAIQDAKTKASRGVAAAIRSQLCRFSADGRWLVVAVEESNDVAFVDTRSGKLAFTVPVLSLIHI